MKLKQQLNMTNLAQYIAFILLQTVIQVVQTEKVLSQPTESIYKTKNFETSFRDPVVWDLNSLYKNSNTNNLSRLKRAATNTHSNQNQLQQPVVDACQSKMEVLTPYYASNSKGQLRTVVNSELMQQAVQVETCVRSQGSQSASKCNSQLDCGCEQKYKWHRLLVLDPRDSGAAKGLFMDWFLFPSSCICRCRYKSPFY